MSIQAALWDGSSLELLCLSLSRSEIALSGAFMYVLVALRDEIAVPRAYVCPRRAPGWQFSGAFMSVLVAL